MKKIITLCFIAITTIFYAQKDEVKALEKAVKKSDFTTAKSSSAVAEALIDNMDDKTKAKFYYLKSQAFYASGAGTGKDLDTTIKAIGDLINHESKTGKKKYSEQANAMKTDIMNKVLKMANEAFENKKYSPAANGFEKMYQISPKDTVYLYNAALIAVQAKNYDLALKHFITLKEVGYTGIQTNYYAVNKDSSEEELFSDKTNRDLAVKTLKTHIKPTEKKAESKRADIVKNIALIYVFEGNNEKALAAIQDAKKESPNDYNLILSEANVYLQLDNQEKASELYKKALSMEPNNPDLNYNLGIMTMNAKQYDEAKSYFSKAIELKPDYADAYLNLSTIEINKGNDINEEMNNLGNSNADNIKYEKLLEEKSELFKGAAAILEDDYLSKFPKSKKIGVYQQLRNIYSALGETDKYKTYKAKVEELENASTN